MFVVIFSAKINQFDQEYSETAERMRDLAINKYGCCEFVASTSEDLELTLSYWNSLDDIASWKSDPEHQRAQQMGRQKWYKSFKVSVAEVVREYEG